MRLLTFQAPRVPRDQGGVRDADDSGSDVCACSLFAADGCVRAIQCETHALSALMRGTYWEDGKEIGLYRHHMPDGSWHEIRRVCR